MTTEISPQAGIKTGLSMKTKLAAAIFAACLLSLATMALIADYKSRIGIKNKTSEILSARASASQSAVETFVKGMRDDTLTLAETALGKNPFRDFATQWNEQFGVNPSEDLHRIYIDENPNPIGEKDNLDKADDGSGYSLFHAQYHPSLRAMLKRGGYYDIFLINLSGEVIYTVFKERDFATNLIDGPWADSGLGEVFREALRTNRVVQSEMAPYGPSNDAPAVFFAAPIHDASGNALGVAAIQANTDRLREALIAASGVDSSSTVTYLTAADGVVRTDLSTTPENDALKITWSSELLGEAIQTGAVAGEAMGILGNNAHIAIKTFDWGDSRWAVVAEWDEAAFLQPIRDLRFAIVLVGVCLLIIAVPLAWFLARSFSRPIEALAGSVDRMAHGEEVDLPMKTRGDEIGLLARSLLQINDMSTRNQEIRSALDDSETPLLIADTDGGITFVNKAVVKIIQATPAVLNSSFDKRRLGDLVGARLDDIFQSELISARKLASVRSPSQSEVTLGDRTIGIQITPLKGEDGACRGYQTQWEDLTNQREIERQIDEMMSAVNDGDFSGSISAESDTPFVRNLIDGLNATSRVVGNFLSELQNTLNALSAGDTTQRMSTDLRGGLLEVAEATNITMAQTGDLVGRIKKASHEIENSTGSISSGATDLSARAESQASSLQETAATMEELASSVRSNSAKIGEVNQLSAASSQAAETGRDVVNNAVSAMARIEDSSTKVSEIVTVIDSIAFQTNLLALNAAVEAARAGDAGKGFAVVASEVRTLAQRSADAARDIKELIQESGAEVAAGVELVQSTGASLEEISRGIQQVATTASQITDASREQTNGIEEVAAAISRMDEITQQNSSLADKSAREADALTHQVETLTTLTASFVVENDPSDRSLQSQMGQPVSTEAQLDADWDSFQKSAIEDPGAAMMSFDDPEPTAPTLPDTPPPSMARKVDPVSVASNADWSEF